MSDPKLPEMPDEFKAAHEGYSERVMQLFWEGEIGAEFRCGHSLEWERGHRSGRAEGAEAIIRWAIADAKENGLYTVACEVTLDAALAEVKGE